MKSSAKASKKAIESQINAASPKSGVGKEKPAARQSLMTLIGIGMSIFDSYWDFALIVQWYNLEGDEEDSHIRLASLLVFVVLLSNVWSVYIMYKNKFNGCLSFIFGILGLSLILASYRAYKKKDFNISWFRKVKYYHAMFESLPSGAIKLYYVYTTGMASFCFFVFFYIFFEVKWFAYVFELFALIFLLICLSSSLVVCLLVRLV